MHPHVLNMLPISAVEWMAREEWLNNLRARFHPVLISLLEPLLRSEMMHVFHRGRLTLHATAAMRGSLGVISDSFGPPTSPILSSIVVDARVGSSLRVIVTRHGGMNGRPIDSIEYDEERMDVNLYQLLIDSIERSTIEEEEQTLNRDAAHRRLPPPPPLVQMVSAEVQTDVVPPPVPHRPIVVSTESQVDLLPLVHPPPPPPPVTVCSETQTEAVSRVESGVQSPPLPLLFSVESQTVVESKEMATQMDDEDGLVEGEEMEIRRGEDPDELDLSLLIEDDAHLLMDDGTPLHSPLPSDGSSIDEEEMGHLIERDDEEEEEMEEMEDEEEMEANDEDEEEAMMGGEMHLNQSIDDGVDAGAGADSDEDEILPSRQTRKRRLSSASPPPVPPKKANLSIKDFALPSPPLPTRRHTASILACLQALLAVISFPKVINNKVKAKEVDGKLMSKWMTLSITCGHRRRMVEDVCQVAVSRLTKTAIDNPAYKMVHKAFAKATTKVLEGYACLFDKANSFASVISTEFASLPPRPPRFRANRVKLNSHHKRLVKAFKNKAASHLIRVREWSELAKELPY